MAEPAVKEPRSSVFAPELPAPQAALFRETLAILNSTDVRYAIAGAFALQQRTGIWRGIKDLDIFLPADQVQQALDAFRQAGFRCEVTDPVWLAKARRDDFFVDFVTGMSNAVLQVEESWIERASMSTILGVVAPVIAAEELLVSKLFVTRRERFDGADIAHIIYATRGELDWARISELIGEHWELLLWSFLFFFYVYPGSTQFVPQALWQDLMARLMHRLATPDPHARFRGSLIDDNMFAIDVQHWGLPNLLEESRHRCMKERLRTEQAAD